MNEIISGSKLVFFILIIFISCKLIYRHFLCLKIISSTKEKNVKKLFSHICFHFG